MEAKCVSETSEVFKQLTRLLSLRMETKCVSETSEVFKQLTRLSAREEFIQEHFEYTESGIMSTALGSCIEVSSQSLRLLQIFMTV
jgi:hypothetical protein